MGLFPIPICPALFVLIYCDCDQEYKVRRSYREFRKKSAGGLERALRKHPPAAGASCRNARQQGEKRILLLVSFAGVNLFGLGRGLIVGFRGLIGVIRVHAVLLLLG